MVNEAPCAPTWHRRLARYTRERHVHEIAACHVPCEHCGALHYMEEGTGKSTMAAPKFSTCCSNGRVDLPNIGQEPRFDELEGYMTNDGMIFYSTTVSPAYRPCNHDMSWILRVSPQIFSPTASATKFNVITMLWPLPPSE